MPQEVIFTEPTIWYRKGYERLEYEVTGKPVEVDDDCAAVSLAEGWAKAPPADDDSGDDGDEPKPEGDEPAAQADKPADEPAAAPAPAPAKAVTTRKKKASA